MNTKFGYFFANSSTSNRAGYVTIAIARSEKTDFNQTHIASLSFCSPKDPFNKKLGRKIAEGRLKSAKDSFSVNIDGSVSDVVKGVMFEAIEKKLVPSWVYKAAKHGRLNYGLNRNTTKLPDCTSVFNYGNFLKNICLDMETSGCDSNCCCSEKACCNQ